MRYKIKFFSFESWKTWCASIFNESLHKQILFKATDWFRDTWSDQPLHKQMVSKYHFIHFTSNWWEICW